LTKGVTRSAGEDEGQGQKCLSVAQVNENVSSNGKGTIQAIACVEGETQEFAAATSGRDGKVNLPEITTKERHYHGRSKDKKTSRKSDDEEEGK